MNSLDSGSYRDSESCRFSVASYNIHRCVGLDGRRDAGRVAQVIKDLQADIIGLQEVLSIPGGGKDSYQLEYLAKATGLSPIAGLTIQKHKGEYGNALLTRHRILEVRRFDLSVPGREPRGALDVDINIRGEKARVIVTHLGLSGSERRYQVKQLLTVLSEERDGLIVVLSDVNEWLPLGRPLRWLYTSLGKPRACRTFPAPFPLLALDRIWVRPKEALVQIDIHNSSIARIASDHLPLRAIITTRQNA